MALLGREFIAVPDGKKHQIVFKWPDVSLRRFSKVIVEPDQQAVFVNKGQVIGVLPPGRHGIDADELPFLGAFIDAATGGRAYRAELFFVGTREYTDNTFGGRIDDTKDPQTGMLVTLRVFGEYSMKATDPIALITNMVGTVDVSDNEAITNWMSDQLLKVMRTSITQQIVRNGWPVLGLSAYTPDIEKTVVEAANGQLTTYGVSIIRMGNFDINLAEEDEANLKNFAKDSAYSKMAGSFGSYAQGEALLGAGEGMAKGGGGANNAFIGVGMGVGQQVGQVAAQPPPQPQVAPVAAAAAGAGTVAGVVCANCSATNAAGAKFCASCGTALPKAGLHCTNCGEELPAGAKFCPGCGTKSDQ